MSPMQVRKIIQKEKDNLIKLLALEHWDIKFEYDLDDLDIYGECHKQYDYKRATIRFNPKMFEERAAVVKTLRHELFHIVLAPFDLYMESIDELLIDGTDKAHILGKIWTHAHEQGVLALELIWQQMTNENRS